MLTRLKVDGFKNLVGIDVSFGPFTCIAGPNSVGKSNLFDAITFLSALASRPLLEAALSVRTEQEPGADVRSIFHRVGNHTVEEMSFEAQMLIPRTGTDDLGQEATAATTFLRYRIVLRLDGNKLSIRREELNYISQGSAKGHLPFPHSPAWRRDVVHSRRTRPLISTEEHEGTSRILLHLDLGPGYKGGGRPRPHMADRLPRTVLQGVNAVEQATAVVARREMQSWRLLQLEPSALRAPDRFTAPSAIAANGAHLPATLARLAQLRAQSGYVRGQEDVAAEHTERVYAVIANRLAELTEGVRSIRVAVDERRELLTLMLRDQQGTEHEARSLSDGTLRFLALAILESDPEARGVLCLEEPENGIHPPRIPAMLRLLRDLAVDPQSRVDAENPLRQVIVTTHSPAVAAQVPEDALLLAIPETARPGGRADIIPVLRWLPGTWRSRAWPDTPTVPLGSIVSYLSPLEPAEDPAAEEIPGPAVHPRQRTKRVMDRDDIQALLPFNSPGSQT
jgi:predicted ATPase